MATLLNCTNDDILDMFPRLSDLGAGAFGEDADTFDDTLNEVIENDPQTRNLSFKTQAINELRILLAYSDEDIEHASRIVLGTNPIVEPEEPFDWGHFQSLRAFWSTVLHAFENDPEVQEGRTLPRADTGGYLTASGQPSSSNHEVGGYTLQRHVYLTKADIEERFTKEKHFAVSLFLSKEDAERAIHKVLVDNSDKIEDWLTHTGVGARLEIEGYISGKGAVVIESVNRQHKAARRIRVTIVSKELRGMAYYIHTVRLYQ